MPSERTLVVVNGQSGAGKSTLAHSLATEFVRRGRTAVAIDFDHVVMMEASHDGVPGPHKIWSRARRVAAALVDAYFVHGIAVVVIEGDFFARYVLPARAERPAMVYDARNDFLAHLRLELEPIFVALRVSAEQALERVRADPERGPQAVSRNPDFIRRDHDWFESIATSFPPTDVVVDTDGRSADDVLADVLARIDGIDPR